MILRYSCKRKAHVFSIESFETKCSSESQTLISIVSPEFEDLCNCDGSDSVGKPEEVIILFSFDLKCDVDIDDI